VDRPNVGKGGEFEPGETSDRQILNSQADGFQSRMGAPVNEDNLEVRAIRGDADALAELLEQVGPEVRREISGRIPPRHRSVISEDDVMQQTYADAFRSIGRFTPLGAGAFRAWLSSLARCNLSDALRMLNCEKRGGRHKKVDGLGHDESMLDLLQVLSGTVTSPSAGAARTEMAMTMTEVVARLPDAYRQVVELYDLEGRSAREAGEVIGRSPGAVFMLRARAHDRLREQLGSAYKFFTDHA